jgi:hypothetical protein
LLFNFSTTFFTGQCYSVGLALRSFSSPVFFGYFWPRLCDTINWRSSSELLLQYIPGECGCVCLCVCECSIYLGGLVLFILFSHFFCFHSLLGKRHAPPLYARFSLTVVYCIDVFLSRRKKGSLGAYYKYIHCTTPNHAKIYVYTIYYNTKSIIWYPTSTDDKMNLECFLINMGILTWHRSPWYFVWHKYDRIRFCNKRMLSEYLSINKFLGKWRWSCGVCILMTCRSRNLLLLSCHRNNKRGFIDVGTTKRPIFLDNDCIDCQPHTNEK